MGDGEWVMGNWECAMGKVMGNRKRAMGNEEWATIRLAHSPSLITHHHDHD
jgi:hypothetical protein